MYSGSMAESASPVAAPCSSERSRAGRAEDGGDGELDAGLRGPPAALDLLGDRHALVDVGQRLVVARLEAEVQELEAVARAAPASSSTLLASRFLALA